MCAWMAVRTNEQTTSHIHYEALNWTGWNNLSQQSDSKFPPLVTENIYIILFYSIDWNDLILSSSLSPEYEKLRSELKATSHSRGFLCASPRGLIYGVACIVHDNISMNSNINLASPRYEQWSTITYGWRDTEGEVGREEACEGSDC